MAVPRDDAGTERLASMFSGPSSAIRRALCCRAATLLLPLLAATSSEAAVRHVVLLQSLERGNLALDFFSGNFRVDIDQGSSEPVTFSQFVVNPLGFEESPGAAMAEYLRVAFVGRPRPDLVVTVGGPAAAFARRYRPRLFPDSPLLFAAVDERFLESAPLADNETAVPVRNDMAGIVDDILQLFPSTSNVFVVLGSGELSRFWRSELEREFQRFRGRVSFTYSDHMPFAEILQRVSALPPHSAVFYLTFDTDRQGGAYPEERVLSDLYAAANAPLFANQDRQLGHGIVGGKLMPIDALGRVTAAVALRIMNGESPARVRMPVQTAGPPVFDWRQLDRWRVNEGRLPPQSVVRFREPGAWQRYRWVIVSAAVAMLIQALLIAGLLVNRTRRRDAERSLRENVAALEAARRALSSLSGRLMSAQEQERTRLARELHDDIGQRVSFLAMDLAQLRDTLPDDVDAQGQARELQEAVVSLGKDLQGISHRLHSSKIDLLGLAGAAASLCKELAGRHGLRIEYAHDGVPDALAADVATSLFRVLQEALANAVKHSRAGRCRVALTGSNGDLTLVVSDDGRGFDTAAALGGHGLGLVSMQERLRLVNGDLAIESGAGSGTTVRARVPATRPAPLEAHPAAPAAPPTTA